MTKAVRRRLAVVAFLLLCSLGTANTAWHVRNMGDGLSIVDPYSESNAVRAARNFLDRGLFADDGLGNVLYPGLYSDEGFVGYPKDTEGRVTPEGVYTHYPPGPEYLLYLAMKVFGPTPVVRSRLLPLTICWGATLFFGLTIRKRFGAAAGWFVMLACTALPQFSDANAFLHYDGYAFALLLVEIGLCLRNGVRIWPFAVLGFLQGWLSFDYVFLVTLVPGAMAFALPRLLPGETQRLRLGVLCCLAAGAGFVFAHLLHFVEIWTYFGSFDATLRDLAGAALYRSGLESGGLPDRLLKMDGLIFSYFVSMFPLTTFFWHPDAAVLGNWHMCRFLGLTLGPWWLILTLGFLLHSARTKTQASLRDTALLGDWLVVSLCGFVPSVLWVEVMVNHGMEHRQFLYRHLFFAFFLWLLFAVVALVERRSQITRSAAASNQPLQSALPAGSGAMAD